MKILLVEDEDRSARQTLEVINRVVPGSVVDVQVSRDHAVAALRRSAFDLIVCDLKIPPTDDSADIDERHGIAVQAASRVTCPGTPLVFLTAFADRRIIRPQLSAGGTANVFGIENYPLVQVVEKDDLDEFENLLIMLKDALSSLVNSCAIESSVVYDEMFLRAVRMYAKQISMPAAQIEDMPGGLSGAPLGRVTFRSPISGEANIFIKVVSHEEAVDETKRFNEFVPTRIALGHFAHSLPPMLSGLRSQAALVSSLASGCTSFFHLLSEEPLKAAAAVRTLRNAVRPWANDSPPTPISLMTLRRSKVEDEKLFSSDIDLSDLMLGESAVVDIRKSISHGDLHGENLLVTQDARPVLIDFGDLNIGFAPIDPVTLELSIIFHRSGPARHSKWAKSVDWESWSDVEAFTRFSPYEAFIRECREWAFVQDSANSVYAVAYAHAMRQFKYPDVDKQIARAVAASALNAVVSDSAREG